MSTSSNSISSNTIAFNGISQYASDFQAVLNKSVQVAQIPLTLLQTHDSAVLSQQTAFGTLNDSVGSLVTSLQNLGTVASNQALSATSSDPTVVSVADSGATSAASYNINSITSIAAAASERSTRSFGASTAVSATGEMQLVSGSKTYDLTFSGHNTLQGLADAINTSGAGVTASVLTTSAGNYLSVSSNSPGATTLKLYDGATATGADVLTNTNQGTNAVFQLNGIDVVQSSNVVNNMIPGLTFTLLGSSSAPVTLSLASDPSQLSSALQDFVTKYNSLQTEIQSQTGTSGGALAGNTILNQVQNALRQLTSYTTPTGSVQSLADLGIEFSSTGVATLNPTTFSSLSSAQINDAFQYLGSATSGLGRFSASLAQFSDPVNGLIQSEMSGLKKTDQHLQAQMSALNTRISAMQTALTAQLETADALQNQLQSQQQVLTGALQAVSLVLYGRNNTNF